MNAPSLALACAVSLVTGMFLPQTDRNPSGAGPQRYEAATVKPCKPEDQVLGPGRGLAGGTNATISTGRFNVPCVTVEQLVYLAYAGPGARDDEHLINDGLGGASNETKVRGGPDWAHSYKDKFEIEATAPGVTERTVLMGTMLRTLLEERFHLQIHRETEQVGMFALDVAKGGLKVKPMQPGDCDADQADSNDPNAAKPHCGGINTAGSGPNVAWTFVGFPLSAVADRLSGTLRQHVVDQTGITDTFILRLEFHPDENTPGIVWPAERDADTSAPQAASIFTALEQQLGLKIEKTKGPRGFIVIDHVERPAPGGLAWLDTGRPGAR
jgi:uncharacterized protein (TIGR03435 family)